MIIIGSFSVFRIANHNVIKFSNQDANEVSIFNYRYYVIAIIIGPILFYIPRFFEIVTVYKPIDITTNTDCSSFRPSIPVLEIPCIKGTCSLQIGEYP